MPARTLVIGIPLPHASFDNYSFISAPSISEYSRLVVDMQAVSRAVDEVIEGSGNHSTFDGQPVVNADAPAMGFALPDLLSMRRREAAWFFDHGGTAACVAYPDARHAAIAGAGSWARYEWLPEPCERGYQTLLLPGFGTGGANVDAVEHPFAQYVTKLGPRLAYRAFLDETASYSAVVIGRSPSGIPIVFELRVGRGRIVFLPPVRDFGNDRGAVAEVLFDCFERLDRTEPGAERGADPGQGEALTYGEPQSGVAGEPRPGEEAPEWMRGQAG